VAETTLPPLMIEISAEVLDRNGQLLRAYTVADGRWRMNVDLGDVDPLYIDMLLAYEDKRFFDHAGVDPRAMARAALQSLPAGRIVAGGSTLTMQVARLLENSGTGRWRGKIRQTRVALALEQRLTKDQILTLFLRRRLPREAEAHSDSFSNARAAKSGFSPMTLTVLLGLAGIGCCVAMSMPQVHIVAFCVDLGYGPAVGGQMLSLMLLGGVASRLVSGMIADRIGGVRTLLIGSGAQTLALALYIPAGGLTSLYVVSLVFGLSQGGIVPSYAVIVREYLPAREAGSKVGFVMMTTIIGMALGGWMTGWIYDQSGSYFLAFVNGIAWNLLNVGIMLVILLRTRGARLAPA
jgi:cyanate permease